MRASLTTLCTSVALLSAASPPGAHRALAGDVAWAESEVVGTTSSTEEITIDRAIELSLESSPALAAAASAVSAAGARLDQAGRLPNPELEIEVENFGTGRSRTDVDLVERTAAISQPILLGGKRSRRRAVARAEVEAAAHQLERVRLDVVAATVVAFHRALAAEQRAALAAELLEVAERFAEVVEARVDAGKVSPVEASRADVEVARARVELRRAEHDLAASRVRLAMSWGSPLEPFGRTVGELPVPTMPPHLADLRGLLEGTPEVAALEAGLEHQRRVVALEDAFRLPDLTVRVGPRRLQETGESAWVAGLSIPIPIFDRNQGSRAAAEFELERQHRDAESVRAALEAELAVGLERLRVAAEEVTALEAEVVPAAESAFAAAERGYREGKFSFLAVLDAQRALFAARWLLLDSREAYATVRAEVERLVGGPVLAATRVASERPGREGGVQ